ncbi:hypothetical protein [Streptomyces sp. ME18-1-4]|uniref:hypothetical protein n=1 Tax=Streptomyces sp. ME18-1-4 TaxID=3028685 RepID=UPI0029B6A102|nr:hypothetical protein [Streptomyces sp. ME18-1-4]MDX3247031.1 hypothetical protein [Streptomyces sp. ME18-1-4]
MEDASARRPGEDTLGMSFGVAAMARGERFGRGGGLSPGVEAPPSTSVGRPVSTGTGRSPAGGASAPDRVRGGRPGGAAVSLSAARGRSRGRSGEDDECPPEPGSPVGMEGKASDVSGTGVASGS